MKRVALSLVVLAGLVCLALAQPAGVVEVKGIGADRTQAISDAKRAAVEQVMGAELSAYTSMENFKVIQDVVRSRTEGYITSFEVIQETSFPDRYEVTARAGVSASRMEADAKSLAQWLGGLRFMVVYDPQKPKTAEEKALYDYAYERVNEYLARHDFRYVEKRVFDRLKDEAVGIAGVDLSGIEYARKLAFYAGAEFFVYVENLVSTALDKAMGITGRKTAMDLKSYDNCTAEGLGTVVGEGDWQVDWEGPEAPRKAIDPAARVAADKLFYLTLNYLGEWCNNGAPFELRFYGVNEDRMDNLMDKLLADPDFGGQLEPVLAGDYWCLNLTFRKTAYEMRRKIRDVAQAAGMPLETKLQYGRQISFAPKDVRVPEAEEKKRADELLSPTQK